MDVLFWYADSISVIKQTHAVIVAGIFSGGSAGVGQESPLWLR